MVWVARTESRGWALHKKSTVTFLACGHPETQHSVTALMYIDCVFVFFILFIYTIKIENNLKLFSLILGPPYFSRQTHLSGPREVGGGGDP